MVRPFTLRDLALVRRLSEQGICLHIESALAEQVHPLRGAITSMVVGGKYPTLVHKSEEPEDIGFIQLALEEEPHHAHVLYMSPAINPPASGGPSTAANRNQEIWFALLREAVREVGRLGIHSIVAEVAEKGPELPVLRQAGFAVYTRQDIWHLYGQNDHPELPGRTVRLLPYLSSDDWDIQLLYSNTVPQLVQLVEPAPTLMNGDGWVLRDEQSELAAFIHVHEGSAASWLRFFIHPSAEGDAAGIVRAALKMEGQRRRKPIYCCVRRYEGWLPAALEQSGFTIWGSQAVLVKYTVQHKRRAEPQLAVNLESGGMPVTSPFVKHYPIEEYKEN